MLIGGIAPWWLCMHEKSRCLLENERERKKRGKKRGKNRGRAGAVWPKCEENALARWYTCPQVDVSGQHGPPGRFSASGTRWRDRLIFSGGKVCYDEAHGETERERERAPSVRKEIWSVHTVSPAWNWWSRGWKRYLPRPFPAPSVPLFVHRVGSLILSSNSSHPPPVTNENVVSIYREEEELRCSRWSISIIS